MKLKDKVTIARELAAVALEGFDFLSVVESEFGSQLNEEMQIEIHDIITIAIAAEIRGN